MDKKHIIVILFTAVLISGCRLEKETPGSLYLSNTSQNDFDSATFDISIDSKTVTTDGIKNKYLSSHWKEKKIEIPKRSFNFEVTVAGKGFYITKDTLVEGRDSLAVFVRFNFYPYHKRYRNPGIIKYLAGETTRFKAIADSLYENNLLTNASEFLDDTIPTSENIEIIIRQGVFN